MGATREGERVDTFNTTQATRYGQLTQGVDDNNTARFNAVDNDGNSKVVIQTLNEDVSVQNPIQIDGDSVYVKDIWVDESIVTNWLDTDSTGDEIIHIPFNNLHTAINNISSDNPKILRIHFNRTVSLNQIGLGCAVHPGKSFSNTKIVALGSGEVERTVLDNSGDNNKYTSKNYEFGPELCNAIKIEFHTDAEVTISNITIHKVIQVAARLKALKPDGTVINIDATSGGNLKSAFEEFDDTFYDNPLPIMKGFNLPRYDDITLTYIISGNGEGEIETVVYKYLTVIVATLTLSYNIDNKLIGVVQS